jgi:hypothetical protein
MAVYVDNFQSPYGRMLMCHMIADTQKELLEMADKIGVQKKWIQDYGTQTEHFDICMSKRKKAIEFGALEINMRELVIMTANREHKP